MMDFEPRNRFVIGRKGRDLTREHALDTCSLHHFNDFSARDTQMQERPLSMGR